MRISGDVLELDADNGEIVGKVPTGMVFVDGSELGDPDGREHLESMTEVEVLTRMQDGELLALFADKWALRVIERHSPETALEPLIAAEE